MVLDADIREGRRLYGNDFDLAQIEQWFEAEKEGFFTLERDLYQGQRDNTFPNRELNRRHGEMLGRKRFDNCVALGCATGQDINALCLDIGRIVAIEPAQEWWQDKIGNVPSEYRMPQVSGAIDLPDGSMDLAVAMGVLHHVPNVEFVISELGRTLKPGGMAIIREPIVSMGDFTQPRPGLTKHERGIPKQLMESFIENAGLAIRRTRLFDTPGLRDVLGKLGVLPGNSSLYVSTDELISSALAFNAKYWRPRTVDKLAPSSCLYIAEKK